MRRILVDSARARDAQKRGADAVRVSSSDDLPVGEKALDLLRLDEALCALADVDKRQNLVVELRFFGGLTVDETAAVLGISPETVNRDPKIARAWLIREMNTAMK